MHDESWQDIAAALRRAIEATIAKVPEMSGSDLKSFVEAVQIAEQFEMRCTIRNEFEENWIRELQKTWD